MRETVFISKATPEDDEFVLWLAPRLEAAGYTVFADILSLQAGDRWRKVVTNTLQNKSAKMLLCCQDLTLGKDGVQEEIGIALDLAKELTDPRFIIPLRLKKHKKLFGVGELQYVNFIGSWANGLHELIASLEKQNVPKNKSKVKINRNWELYKKRSAIKVYDREETLGSNWLRIADTPKILRYFEPSGAMDKDKLLTACRNSASPTGIHERGFFSFCTQEELNEEFSDIGKFRVRTELNLLEVLKTGCEELKIESRDLSNIVSSMFRVSWENFCRSRNLLEYAYSSQLGFHVTADQVPIGKRVQWGASTCRRSSMLRNIKQGKVWQYGVSASPHFWPFFHFRLKSRVVFSPLESGEAGTVFDDARKQHKYRRSCCSVWRNKAWHGRLMAYIKLLSGEDDNIQLPLSKSSFLLLEKDPLSLASPVSTELPDTQADDDEETDLTTLGNFDIEEDSP